MAPLEDVEITIHQMPAARLRMRRRGWKIWDAGARTARCRAAVRRRPAEDGRRRSTWTGLPAPAVVSRLAAAHGRILGADAIEVESAQAVVLRVLDHPLVRAAARAAEEGGATVRRQSPTGVKTDRSWKARSISPMRSATDSW